jgi:hypothetical protein
MQACPKTQSPGGHPLVFMFLFFDFELWRLLDAPAGWK